MKIINYTEISDRFSHIDGELVDYNFNFLNQDKSYYQIQFYPWWEHPKYIEAIEKNKKWEFSDIDEGSKTVTILPVIVVETKISNETEITEIQFSDNHPLLWEYDDLVKIHINSSLDIGELEKWLETIDVYSEYTTDILSHLDPITEYKPPFAIDLPLTIAKLFITFFEDNSVKYLADISKLKPSNLKLFLIDDDDYIIAHDFNIKLPDFEHKSSWFSAK
jgi:hypothetical protein